MEFNITELVGDLMGLMGELTIRWWTEAAIPS